MRARSHAVDAFVILVSASLNVATEAASSKPTVAVLMLQFIQHTPLSSGACPPPLGLCRRVPGCQAAAWALCFLKRAALLWCCF